MRVLNPDSNPEHTGDERTGDEGAVLVWIGLLITVIIGFGALAVDFGSAYAVKRSLSVTADSAALAGAQEAGLRYKDFGCGSSLTSAAVSAAQANYAVNAPPGGPSALSAADVTVNCSNQAVTVRVNTSATLDTFLGQAVGFTSMSPGATATAEVFGAQQQGGLRPFTICLADALVSLDLLTHQSIYQNHNASGEPAYSCTTFSPTAAPGNWGLAHFGLGGSTPTLRCLILHGYGPDCGGSATGIDLGSPQTPEDPEQAVASPGNTGNTFNINDQLDTLVGEVILLPVGDRWAGPGNNATYQGLGGLPVKLCGWVMPKPNGTIDDSNTGGGCWSSSLYSQAEARMKLKNSDPLALKDVSLVLQWQLVDEWVTSYLGQSTSDRCRLNQATCIATVRLVE